jgi:hypothetical protein
MSGNWGIGLGAAASGFTRGYGLGTDIQSGMKANSDRRELAGIDKDAKKQFDTDVAAGKEQSGNWDTYYSKYIVPKKTAALVSQGNLDEAEKWRDWADKDEARKGGRLFSSGIVKGQAGDMKGALEDFISAGKIKGYGGDYEIGKVEEKDGVYNVMLKDGEGNEYPQTFKSPDEVLKFGATYLNPEAAYDDWKASAAKAADYKTDLAKEKDKLGLKLDDDVARKGLGLGTGNDPVKFRKQALDEMANNDDFLAASPDEQSKMIEERAQQIGGASGGSPQAAPAAAKVIVDTQTGQPVGTPLGNAAAKADPAGPLPRSRPEVTGITGAGKATSAPTESLWQRLISNPPAYPWEGDPEQKVNSGIRGPR